MKKSSLWIAIVLLASSLQLSAFGIASAAAPLEIPTAAPAAMPLLRDITDVKGNHALDKNGVLWEWQEGEYIASPVLDRVKGFAKGNIAVRTDGTVWEWEPDGNKRVQPKQTAGLSDIASVYSGHLAIDRKGDVWWWGKLAADYRLGHFDLSRDQPGRERPEKVPGLTHITTIEKLGGSFYALDQAGRVWGWGFDRISNAYPIGKSAENIQTISTGLAISKDWKVLQLDLSSVPVYDFSFDLSDVSAQITEVSSALDWFRSDYSYVVKKDGSLWTWYDIRGLGDVFKLHPVKNVTGVKKAVSKTMAAGTVLHLDGTVSSWEGGLNDRKLSDKLADGDPVGAYPIQPIKVRQAPGIRVNGELWVLPAPPQVYAGRVYVPVRGLMEQLGGSVTLVGDEIVIRFGDKRISLTVGSNVAQIDGTTFILDDPPQVWRNRTLIPLKFAGEALGGEVRWDAGKHEVVMEWKGQ
jgi:hypothetical protein